MKLHREGFVIIPLAAVLIAGLYLLLSWLIPIDLINRILGASGIIFWMLIINFFRVPYRVTQASASQIIAPADGKIVVIENTHEPEHLKEERIQISIFMSPLDVHQTKSPVTGQVDYYKYHPGKYLVAWHPKSSTENERTTISFSMISGTRIVIRQIAGAVARRIRFYKAEGDRVSAGDEVGFIRFGSRIDTFLPLNAKVKVAIGERTVGGKTVLAELEEA